MKDKIKGLVNDQISSLGLFVADVYDSADEGILIRNVELDSDKVIDVETITLATKIINPILDENGLCDDIDVLDIHSKEKGENDE